MKLSSKPTTRSKVLTPSELQLLIELINEIESLIDADDGTVFQMQHIDYVSNAKEILNEGADS